MHQGYGLAAGFQRVLYGHTHQPLGAGHGNRLDAHAGIQTNLLLAALEHVLVEEFDQLGALRSSLLPFDAGVNVFGILAEDDHVHALGMLHRRGHALVILHRAHATIEVQNLPQCNIQRADPAAHGSGQRAFDGNSKFANRIDGIVRQPVIELCLGFFPRENLVPGHAALAFVGFFRSRVEDAERRLPDVAPGAITLDEGDDWIVRNVVLAGRIADLFSLCRDCHAVISARHLSPPIGSTPNVWDETNNYREFAKKPIATFLARRVAECGSDSIATRSLRKKSRKGL